MPRRPFRLARSFTGFGLFATRPIKKNLIIAEYKGPRLTTAEAEKAERRGNRYLYEISKHWTIDGTPHSNVARYFNHSCNPNAEIDGLARPRLHQDLAPHQAGRGDHLRLRHRLSQERHRPLELQMLALPAPAGQARAAIARRQQTARRAAGASAAGDAAAAGKAPARLIPARPRHPPACPVGAMGR